ncbi:MAG: flagellar hook-length control protein FliK, partial [Campylobacterota bacterium]|nr:flagellar hook-length control protein FliK [Campylobacterota bacterium]
KIKVKDIVEEKVIKKDKIDKPIEELKSIVEQKTETIKEAVSDIKIKVKDIVEEKVIDTKEKIDTIKEIIIVKTTTIETAANDIKNAVDKSDKKSILIIDDESNKTKVDSKTSLMASMFQSNQQKNKQTVSMEQVSDAKKNIEDNKNINAVKQSANMLDLDAKDLELELKKEPDAKKVENQQSLEQKKDSLLNLTQNKTLNKIIIDKQIESNISNNTLSTKETAVISKRVESKPKEVNINVNVPQNVVETIQTKIIGAQQKVGNFMSEVARNMYLNYKPPLTAFRMNLNPANLGSISIIMKANKADSSISVNMNMSSSSTMETFAENKTALQNALQKQLGENSNITLNFGMQENNSNSEFNQSEQNNSNKKESGQSNEDISLEEEELEIVENLDYM